MPDTYDRHGPRDRHLRVGDAEREAVAGILRAQYVAGRLDSDEFEQRLERCLAAKTLRRSRHAADRLPRPRGAGRGAAGGPRCGVCGPCRCCRSH